VLIVGASHAATRFAAAFTAGSSKAVNMPMMVITTSSSPT